jgi:starvation-inducible DNA-binding protein
MSARTISKPRGGAVHPTRNDLPLASREAMIELLDARLADAVDLQTQTKQAHWNVKGPTFVSLHELFDKIHEDVREYVDTIAERAVQLGGAVHGTARQAAARSTLPEFPDARTGRESVEAVATVLAKFGGAARAAIGAATDAGDLDTADLFTEVSRGIDKWLWFAEAHTQAER